ncbi:MAG: hypothetical protein UT37_C0001G0013 [Parcubacteria group bacterium GW2011_GWA2_39_18]|nr:MAG: hypothetical protein UT37_C0001G0013 [Parcubacteria group bacterium GW2011_GWA2_39_18]
MKPMPKKILIILIIGIFIPMVFAFAETPSPSPSVSVSPTITSTPQAPSPPPGASLGPEDVIKFLSTPSLLISPQENGVLYIEPNKTINFSATVLNLPSDMNLKWYVNGSFVYSGKSLPFNSGNRSPARYLLSVSANLSSDPVYVLRGISQVSASIIVKVVDIDLYVYAPESVSAALGAKILPKTGSSLVVNAISFLGDGQFYYNWSVDGDKQDQLSGIGKNSIKIQSGNYPTTKIISLGIKDSSGKFILNKKMGVPIVKR